MNVLDGDFNHRSLEERLVGYAIYFVWISGLGQKGRRNRGVDLKYILNRER